MPAEVWAAIIAAIVSTTGFLVSIRQARKERSKWLVDFKSTHAQELYRQRLSAYPAAFKIIGRLSHGADPKPDSDTARQVALELNEWIYGLGGLCADRSTRGALLGLRSRCREWARHADKGRPADLYQWRNLALTSLRLDIDLLGLEEYDFGSMPTALERLKSEVEQLTAEKSAAKRGVR